MGPRETGVSEKGSSTIRLSYFCPRYRVYTNTKEIRSWGRRMLSLGTKMQVCSCLWRPCGRFLAWNKIGTGHMVMVGLSGISGPEGQKKSERLEDDGTLLLCVKLESKNVSSLDLWS
jgi:hypothetical protein